MDLSMHSNLTSNATKAKPIATSSIITLEEAIDTHGQAILRYCHLLLGDYHEAQDASQTTFIRAFYHSKEPHYSPQEVSAVLYKIAYNLSIDIMRRRKRFFSFLQSAAKDQPQSYTMEEDFSQDVLDALATIPPQDRAILIHRLLHQMDYDSLSQIYHLPPSTLRKRYQRAKTKLANVLRMEGYDAN